MDAPREGTAYTQLVLNVFRLNGALVATGDELVGDLGLSTARWQVLGMLAKGARTVSDVARSMGLTRQSVQRTADCLRADGLVETGPNPGHRTAKLYQLTVEGARVMGEVDARQRAWALRIASGMGASALEGAGELLAELCGRLENELAEERLK